MNTNVEYKIQVSLRRAEDDSPVFLKQDGGRFEHKITVKLNVNTKYTLFVTTRPARPVQRVLVKAEKMEISRQKPQRNDDNCCIYHADWSTVGYDVSKSSQRTYLPITIEMEDGVRIEPKIQIKLYPQQETTHCKWGQEFHMLDMECSQKSGQCAVTIKKEVYI